MKQITAYQHTSPVPEQLPDLRRGNYYCSVKDGERIQLLLGPFKSHKKALLFLPKAKAKALEFYFWSAFYSFGTLRMESNFTKPGLLNLFFPELFTT